MSFKDSTTDFVLNSELEKDVDSAQAKQEHPHQNQSKIGATLLVKSDESVLLFSLLFCSIDIIFFEG